MLFAYISEKSLNMIDNFAKQYQSYVANLLKVENPYYKFEEAMYALNVMKDKIERYRKTASSIMNRTLNELALTICLVNCNRFKEQLANEANDAADALLLRLVDEMRKDTQRILDLYNATIEKVNKRCQTPEEFYDFSKYFEVTQKSLSAMEDSFRTVEVTLS